MRATHEHIEPYSHDSWKVVSFYLVDQVENGEFGVYLVVPSNHPHSQFKLQQPAPLQPGRSHLLLVQAKQPERAQSLFKEEAVTPSEPSLGWRATVEADVSEWAELEAHELISSFPASCPSLDRELSC